MNLPRTSELKSRISALIEQANKVHQINASNNVRFVKNEPIHSNANQSTINGIPEIQRQATFPLTQILAPQNISIPKPVNLIKKPLEINVKMENLQASNVQKQQTYDNSSNSSGCTICLESFDEVNYYCKYYFTQLHINQYCFEIIL